MDQDIITQGFFLFFGSAMLAVLTGIVIGCLRHSEWAVGIGSLVFGIGSMVSALWVGSHQYLALEKMVLVQGKVMEYSIDYGTSSEKQGEEIAVSNPVPIVRFTANNGDDYILKGPEGGQTWPLGQSIPVRYDPQDPNQAIIANFQNQWGLSCVFIAFGVMPLIFGIFFTIDLCRTNKAYFLSRDLHPPDKPFFRSIHEQEKERYWVVVKFSLTWCGTLVLLGAFVSIPVLNYLDKKATHIFGVVFFTVGVALAIYVPALFLSFKGFSRTRWEGCGVLGGFALVFMLTGAAVVAIA